jgi:5-methylcytosine-specific restriction endonuclease McrA
MNKQKTLMGPEQPLDVPKGRIAKKCHCGIWFILPASHAPRHHSCSGECAKEARAAIKLMRSRPCIECGMNFIPRSYAITTGGGKFCSHKCAMVFRSRTSEHAAALARGVETRRENVRTGKTVLRQPRGETSPLWKGGRAATHERSRASGVNAKYRAANPDRVLEWSRRRSNRKTGRLPRGTVARLRELQRNRCALCAKSLASGFHVDHVIPLALGGEHSRLNVQLLCPTCNVRKNAKHPIRFAQENGKLL